MTDFEKWIEKQDIHVDWKKDILKEGWEAGQQDAARKCLKITLQRELAISPVSKIAEKIKQDFNL